MGWFIGIILGLLLGWFVVCCAVGWMATKDPLWDTPNGLEDKENG